MAVTDRQRSIMEHALGNKNHYRNYYCAGPGHDAFDDLLNLVDGGYMIKTCCSFVPDFIFIVTEKGKRECFQEKE